MFPVLFLIEPHCIATQCVEIICIYKFQLEQVAVLYKKKKKKTVKERHLNCLYNITILREQGSIYNFYKYEVSSKSTKILYLITTKIMLHII